MPLVSAFEMIFAGNTFSNKELRRGKHVIISSTSEYFSVPLPPAIIIEGLLVKAK